jgi:agmatinase
MMLYALLLLMVAFVLARGDDQAPLVETNVLSDTKSETWLSKYGKPIDQPFSGFLSFSHIPHTICLEDESATFDIAILGFPFDTAVSYRPGARFGPYAIRSGSRRQRNIRGYTLSWAVNPYDQGVSIIDCGDVRLSSFHHTVYAPGPFGSSFPLCSAH